MREQLIVWHVGPAPGGAGGIGSVIDELANGEWSAARIQVQATWWRGHPVRSLAAAVRVCLRLARERPDVVHGHLSVGGSFVREGLVLWVAARCGVPTVVTIHGSRFGVFASSRPSLVRRVLNRAGHVLVLGPKSLKIVASLGVSSPVEVIGNPVDCTSLSAIRSHRRQRPMTVIFAGEVGPRKGSDLLLESWPAVVDALPDAELYLCGPLRMEVAEWPRRATYLGELSRVDVLDRMAASEVACLPARAEALPMFVLEALGLGLRVVATDVGELGSLRGLDRFVVADASSASLAEELVRACTSTDVETDAPDPAFVSRFDVASVIAAHERVYQTLVRTGVEPVAGPVDSGGRGSRRRTARIHCQ